MRVVCNIYFSDKRVHSLHVGYNVEKDKEIWFMKFGIFSASLLNSEKYALFLFQRIFEETCFELNVNIADDFFI